MKQHRILVNVFASGLLGAIAVNAFPVFIKTAAAADPAPVSVQKAEPHTYQATVEGMT